MAIIIKAMLNERELKKYRKKLLEAKREIWETVLGQKEVEEKLGEMVEEPKDLEDWADFTIEEEKLTGLALQELEILRAIDNALKRIEEGTYGICEVCGGPIEKERLELLPWTTLCAKCSKKFSGQQ